MHVCAVFSLLIVHHESWIRSIYLIANIFTTLTSRSGEYLNSSLSATEASDELDSIQTLYNLEHDLYKH
jgi:hypothetical protein